MWLDSEHISKYRSRVARCLFFSQDRADNILRARVAPKNDRSFTTQIFQVFDFSDMSSDGTSVAALVGRHSLEEHQTRKQNIIARSRAEEELCAAAAGATEAKRVQEHDV